MFAFQYDLDLNMRPVQETLSIDIPQLQAIKEAVVLPGVGCGLLFAKYHDGTETVLCRFTMSRLKEAGEFCKIINHYIKTQANPEIDKKEETICPKCNRPLIENVSTCLFCFNKTSLLRKFFGMMRPHAKAFWGAETLLLIGSLLWLLHPMVIGAIIDKHLKPMQGPALYVVLLAVAMLATRVLGEGFYVVSARIMNRVGVGFSMGLRNMTFDKLQRLSMRSASKHTPGDLQRRVMEDTFNIQGFIVDSGRWAIDQVITFIVVFILLMITNWKLTLLVFVPVPLVALALARFWGFINLRYERQWRKSSRASSVLHDIIQGIRTVKSFGKEDREIAKFARVSRELADVSENNEKLWAVLFPILMFITGIGEFLVLYFGGKSVLGGVATAGMIVQFTMYVGYIYGPLRWLVSFPRMLADAMTSMVKVFEILDEKPEIDSIEQPQAPELTGAVIFEDVTFGYKSYEPVLKELTLSIEPGEMVGLVGKSGVGKSTLINLLMRLYDPNGGSVKISGVDLRDMDPAHLHERIGVVFQETFLFAGSIYENVAYAKNNCTPQEVFAACKTANAHDFIMKTPDGYNTVIGENGHSLSGGERQRLAIARAVIRDPEILILDEATSSLDVETEAAIQEALGKLIKGRTTIAIAHRLSTLRAANRLCVLDEGRVAELGTHLELLKSKGIYYDLVMAQRGAAPVIPSADGIQAGLR